MSSKGTMSSLSTVAKTEGDVQLDHHDLSTEGESLARSPVLMQSTISGSSILSAAATVLRDMSDVRCRKLHGLLMREIATRKTEYKKMEGSENSLASTRAEMEVAFREGLGMVLPEFPAENRKLLAPALSTVTIYIDDASCLQALEIGEAEIGICKSD